MSPLSEEQQRQLVADLVASVSKTVPQWTDNPTSEPGVTLLQLFAWLSSNLLYDLKPSSEHKTALLNQMIAKLIAILPGICTTSGLERPRYFNGQLLTAADLQAEQDYSRNSLKRHNRCLVGTGVVNGLHVSVDSSASTKDMPSIVITPGSAIAPDGQLICICETLRCSLAAPGPSGYVVVRYCERTIDPVPTPSGTTEYSRIEEGVAVTFEEQLLPGAVPIARIKRKAGRWSVDPHFRSNKAAAHTR